MKNLFLLLATFLMSLNVVSQTVIFEDNYESYPTDSSLTQFGYKVWEGTALVADTATSTAYDSIKYVVSDVSKNNWAFRKTVTLEAGKTYTYMVATRCVEGSKHVVSVAPGKVYTEAKVDCYNAEWELHSVEFTAVAGSEEATLVVYRYPKTVVDVDAMSLIEGTVSGLFSGQADAPKLTVSRINDGTMSVSSSAGITALDVYTLNGALVYSCSDVNSNTANFSISSLPNGIYVVSVTSFEGVKSTEKFLNY